MCRAPSRPAADLYELEPARSSCPRTFITANEELLLVLSGTPSPRPSDGDLHDLNPGKIAAFPPRHGNTHPDPDRLRPTSSVLICATADLPEVAEQTETDRQAVFIHLWLLLHIRIDLKRQCGSRRRGSERRVGGGAPASRLSCGRASPKRLDCRSGRRLHDPW
ncbi:MAG: hypothetical protein ACLP0J_03945, partial [Solirubrobacteraceae bacterium]